MYVVVAWDEAYYEYACDAPDYPDTLQYVREGRNCVVLRTFSKAFSLCGVRVGFAVAREEFIDGMMKVKDS